VQGEGGGGGGEGGGGLGEGGGGLGEGGGGETRQFSALSVWGWTSVPAGLGFGFSSLSTLR
jgi:hypothetical protein